MRRIKNSGTQQTFFSLEERHEKLMSISVMLETLNRIIPWEIFRPLLLTVRKDNSVKGGRPPYDEVMMFKCMILQHLYNLSDEQLEYQILDRLSFMKFLGITIASSAPDHNTIWGFREKLKEHELSRQLFDLFDGYLQEHGFRVQNGLMTDATFIEVARQRNTREENKAIKEGEKPESFKEKNDHVLCHKDMEARWTKKNLKTYYGYKDHVTADTEHKFIRDYTVTPASVHDSIPFLSILPRQGHGELTIYADSAYSSAETQAELEYRGIKSEICEKGTRGVPLTDEQIASNHRKSKTRCRVEHIFADIKNRIKGIAFRVIGIKRVTEKIGIMNLAYNMRRLVSLTKIASK